MASKFQNRLVGTIVLVALGVIILPGLLDGKKRHYQDEFAAIPLVPKPGDEQLHEELPPIMEPLAIQPMENAKGATGSKKDALASGSVANLAAGEKKPQGDKPLEVKPNAQRPAQGEAVAPKQETKPANKPQANKSTTKEPEVKPTKESPPSGQAYVVQLGALKNAAKVDEIVATLRLSGYRVFTLPATPAHGKITRIYVGPDVSKPKLQAALPELKTLSGLSGQVKPYTVTD